MKVRTSKIETVTLKRTGGPRAYCEVPKVKALKELVFYSDTYPEFEITQFDLCNDVDEEVGLWIRFNTTIKKKDLFKFIQLVASDFEIGGDERMPVEIRIKNTFDKLKESQERHRLKLKKDRK